MLNTNIDVNTTIGKTTGFVRQTINKNYKRKKTMSEDSGKTKMKLCDLVVKNTDSSISGNNNLNTVQSNNSNSGVSNVVANNATTTDTSAKMNDDEDI